MDDVVEIFFGADDVGLCFRVFAEVADSILRPCVFEVVVAFEFSREVENVGGIAGEVLIDVDVPAFLF
jgi:hypothetical protein